MRPPALRPLPCAQSVGSYANRGNSTPPVQPHLGFITIITEGDLAPDDGMDWGWRVPFLASILLVGIGYFIRRTVQESPVFQDMEQSAHKAEAPLMETLRNHWRQVLLAIGVRAGEGIIGYVFSLLLLIYVPTRLDLPRQVALDAVLWGAAVGVLAIPLFGAMSDWFGRKRMRSDAGGDQGATTRGFEQASRCLRTNR